MKIFNSFFKKISYLMNIILICIVFLNLSNKTYASPNNEQTYALINRNSFTSDVGSYSKDKLLFYSTTVSSYGYPKIVNNAIQMNHYSSYDGYSNGVFLSKKVTSSGFSTAFKFNVGNMRNVYADGWCFVVSAETNKLGLSGHTIGYAGIPNSVAIEYDYFDNSNRGMPPHIALGVNGVVHDDYDDAGYTNSPYERKTNTSICQWIDYDSETNKLEVYVSDNEIRPSLPIVTYDIDISSIVGDTMYFGFTSATGYGRLDMSLAKWVLVNKYLEGGAEFSNNYIEDITAPQAPQILIENDICSISGGQDESGGSGIHALQYNNGDGWLDYEEPFEIDADGCAIGARSVDNAGNISEITVKGIEDDTGCFYEGKGTKNNPYIVRTRTQLAHVRNHSDAYFYFDDTLDRSGYTFYYATYQIEKDETVVLKTWKLQGVKSVIFGSLFTKDSTANTAWSIDSTLALRKIDYFLNATYEVDQNLELYPYFKDIDYETVYSITYDTAGYGPISSGSKIHDVNYILSNTVLEREGYTHIGWSTSEGGSKAYDIGGRYQANENVILYPCWQINTYTITYNTSSYGTILNGTKTYGINYTLSNTILIRTGYTHVGWSTTNGGSKVYDIGATYQTNANLNLYPCWQINTYTITYNTSSYGIIPNGTKTYGINYTLSNTVFERTGYTHIGWSTSEGGSKAYDIGATYAINSNITLYPYWEINTYTITYNTSTYGTISNGTKTYNIDYNLSNTVLERTGYTHVGWSTSEGGSKVYDIGERYQTNANLTLYPCWEINTYTITYNTSSYGTISNGTKTYGIDYSLSDTVLEREGYTHIGWSTSLNGSLIYEFAEDYTIDASLILYPCWQINTYTITYNTSNYGTISNGTKTYGIDYILSDTVLERTGYTHVGWSTSEGGSKAYDIGATYEINSNITLYPCWQINTYTITYNISSYGTISNGTKTYEIDYILSDTVLERNGYTHIGWSTSEGGSKAYDIGATYEINSNITLYPYWQINTYTITYNTSSYGTISNGTKTFDIDYTLSDIVLERTGYTHVGWSITSNGEKAYDLGGAYIDNSNVTLYPYWQINIYTITYNTSTYGSISNGTKTYGIDYILSDAVLERNGYTHIGWSTSLNGSLIYEFAEEYIIDTNIILYPCWQINILIINYNGNGYEIGIPQPAIHTILNNSNLSSYSRLGYNFIGWNTLADGSGTSYNSSNTPNFSFDENKTITLYAMWELKTITIHFNSNGGSDVISISQYYNTIIFSPANPSKNGYIFAGWYSDIDLQSEFIFITMPQNDVTLYAKWLEESIEKFVVTFKENGGNKVNSLTNILKDSYIMAPTTPQKEGYIFVGWYKDSVLTNRWNFENDRVISNITLYAKWIEQNYTLEGIVVDNNMEAVAYAEVYIKTGNIIYKQTITETNGKFSIVGIPVGVYNLVVTTTDGFYKTELLIITDSSITNLIVKLSGYRTNSKLEVGNGSPDVVVDGLDEIFNDINDRNITSQDIEMAQNGGIVEIKLIVTATSASFGNDLIIKAANNNQELNSFLDLSMYKIVLNVDGVGNTSVINELNNNITVIIPLNDSMIGKNNYTIYRLHKGVVEVITTTLNEKGEYLEVTPDGNYIYLHVKNFSTYAIGFDKVEGNINLWWLIILLGLVIVSQSCAIYKIKKDQNSKNIEL